MNHKHIVRYHQHSEKSTYTNKDGKKEKVAYIAQELIKNGELKDYVSITGAFDEGTCRYYFS